MARKSDFDLDRGTVAATGRRTRGTKRSDQEWTSPPEVNVTPLRCLQ